MKPHRNILVLVIVLLALPGLIPPSCAENKALVVGINQYQFQNPERGFNPLNFCVNDAKAYQDILLRKYGFANKDVVLLTDDDATKARIIEEFSKLTKDSTEGDTRIFIFAGHGTNFPDQEGGDEAQEDKQDEVLIPYDAHSKDTCLIDDEISQMLASASPAQWTIILDCCHSGTATKNLSLDLDYRTRYVPSSFFLGGNSKALVNQSTGSASSLRFIDPFSKTKALSGQKVRIAVLAACKDNQEAGEVLNHGSFTNYLIEGYEKGAIIPGQTTYMDMAKYADKTLSYQKGGKKVEQNPQIDVPEEMKNLVFFGSSPSPAETRASTGTSQENYGQSAFEVRVGTSSGQILREGDTLELWVESARDGYLTLMGYWSDGNSTRLYPNEYHEDNHIQAGQRIYIPGKNEFILTINPPFGIDEIVAYVTEKPCKLDLFKDVQYSNSTKSLDTVATKALKVELGNLKDMSAVGHGGLRFESRAR